MELLVLAGQFLGDMPGNGFPFPVRVRGEIEWLSFLGRLFQFFKDLVFPGNDLEFRFEIMFDIHTEQILRQVLDVPE